MSFSNSNVNSITTLVKAFLGDECRRVRVSGSPPSSQELKATIAARFNLSPQLVELHWKDAEGDMITLATSNDVSHAFSELGADILKIYVTSPNHKDCEWVEVPALSNTSDDRNSTLRSHFLQDIAKGVSLKSTHNTRPNFQHHSRNSPAMLEAMLKQIRVKSALNPTNPFDAVLKQVRKKPTLTPATGRQALLKQIRQFPTVNKCSNTSTANQYLRGKMMKQIRKLHSARASNGHDLELAHGPFRIANATNDLALKAQKKAFMLYQIRRRGNPVTVSPQKQFPTVPKCSNTSTANRYLRGKMLKQIRKLHSARASNVDATNDLALKAQKKTFMLYQIRRRGNPVTVSPQQQQQHLNEIKSHRLVLSEKPTLKFPQYLHVLNDMGFGYISDEWMANAIKLTGGDVNSMCNIILDDALRFKTMAQRGAMLKDISTHKLVLSDSPRPSDPSNVAPNRVLCSFVMDQFNGAVLPKKTTVAPSPPSDSCHTSDRSRRITSLLTDIHHTKAQSIRDLAKLQYTIKNIADRASIEIQCKVAEFKANKSLMAHANKRWEFRQQLSRANCEGDISKVDPRQSMLAWAKIHANGLSKC